MSAEDTETKAVEVEVDDDEEETPVQTGESAKEGAQLDSITDLVEEKELNQKKVNDVRSCRDTHVQGHGVRGGAERGRVGRGIVCTVARSERSVVQGPCALVSLSTASQRKLRMLSAITCLAVPSSLC